MCPSVSRYSPIILPILIKSESFKDLKILILIAARFGVIRFEISQNRLCFFRENNNKKRKFLTVVLPLAVKIKNFFVVTALNYFGLSTSGMWY